MITQQPHVSPFSGATVAREADNYRIWSHSFAFEGRWHFRAPSKLSLCHKLLQCWMSWILLFLSGYYPQTFYFCNKYSKYWAFTVKQSCDLKPTAKIISIKTQLSIQLSAHLSWPGSLNPNSQQPPPATSHLWKSSSKRRSFLSSQTPGRGNKIRKENEKKEKQECLFKYRTWITPRKERLEPYYQQGRYLQL